MTVDILKWLVLYLLVLFAFGCGMNQLLWYYADLEYDKCYSLPGGLPNVEGEVTTRHNMKVMYLHQKSMHLELLKSQNSLKSESKMGKLKYFLDTFPLHLLFILLFFCIFAYILILRHWLGTTTTFQEAFLNNTSSVFACQGVSYIYLLSLISLPFLLFSRSFSLGDIPQIIYLFSLPKCILQSNACIVWRRFANLFETSQSLFWASFGLVSLTDFELTGIKEFTRFWALLMFGSYSVCNIIVLLNMLIAMMSNSFQVSVIQCH